VTARSDDAAIPLQKTTEIEPPASPAVQAEREPLMPEAELGPSPEEEARVDQALQDLENAKIDAQLAEICAEDPLAPPC
jgi:hypothetical protein